MFESRFDMCEPHTVEPGPGGGVLSDLGSHLIDQAFWLFGPVASVYAELQWTTTAAGPVDGGFFVSLAHRSSVRSHLQSNKLGQAVTGGGTSPVPAEQAVAVIEIIDAARTSAAENRVVVL